MTRHRPSPHRAASLTPAPSRLPRLWPDLPAQTRAQLGALFAELLRRRPPAEAPVATEESRRADHRPG